MIEDASLLMLGNLAIKKSIVPADQVKSALEEQRKSHFQLGEILLKCRLITKNQLKVLLDIHNLIIFYHESIKFGFIAIVNNLSTEEQIQHALELQRQMEKKSYIGEILISIGAITLDQCDSILKSQKRISNKQEDQKHTFVNCPFCQQSYGILDPDRYRKVRCRHCESIFEVGIVKHQLAEPLEFSPPDSEIKANNINNDKNNNDKNNNDKNNNDNNNNREFLRISSFLNDNKIDVGISLDPRAIRHLEALIRSIFLVMN